MTQSRAGLSLEGLEQEEESGSSLEMRAARRARGRADFCGGEGGRMKAPGRSTLFRIAQAAGPCDSSSDAARLKEMK